MLEAGDRVRGDRDALDRVAKALHLNRDQRAVLYLTQLGFSPYRFPSSVMDPTPAAFESS